MKVSRFLDPVIWEIFYTIRKSCNFESGIFYARLKPFDLRSVFGTEVLVVSGLSADVLPCSKSPGQAFVGPGTEATP